jgi:hypothetical protein
MDLTVRKTSPLIVEDRSWLGDVDGTQATRSITLVVASFTANTHYPKGVLASGHVIGRYTSGVNDGLWGLYVPGATDGRETAVGFLFNTLELVDPAGNASVKVGAPLMERGFIKEAKLPSTSGLDSAAKTDLAAHFIFRD